MFVKLILQSVPMDTINIVVVDDHQIVRDGIKAMFLASKTIRVIGEAAAYDGLMQVLSHYVPHVIILDITLPGKSGVEIASEIKSKTPDIKILILSASTDEETIIEAIQAGADGFLPKDTSKEEFVEAITLIHQGEQYFGAKLSKIIYSSYVHHVKSGNPKEGDTSLSEREISTLKLLSDGLTSKEIADRLNISHRTVETHKTNILKKLNLSNNAELIKYAIRQGIAKL